MAGEKGLQGDPGLPGRDGLPGVPGQQGEKGLNGIDGKHGKDGVDGVGFDDMTLVEDMEGYPVLRFTRGEVEKFFYLHSPIDQGPYQANRKYRKGAVVSLRGGMWIAQKETSARPGDPDSGWRLSVKPGRDGKDGKQGPQGNDGKNGRDGRDLM